MQRKWESPGLECSLVKMQWTTRILEALLGVVLILFPLSRAFVPHTNLLPRRSRSIASVLMFIIGITPLDFIQKGCTQGVYLENFLQWSVI